MLLLLRPAMEIRPSAVICHAQTLSSVLDRRLLIRGEEAYVDVRLLSEGDRLGRRESGEGEHTWSERPHLDVSLGNHGSRAEEKERTNLLLDVVPVSGSVVGDESVVEGVPHGDDPLSHACQGIHQASVSPPCAPDGERKTLEHTLDLSQPLLLQLGGAQDGAGDPRTVKRRVRVQRPNQNLELTVDPALLDLARRDDRERADALAIQAKVLGERLAEDDLVALGDKVSDGEGVVVGVARGESLVGLVRRVAKKRQFMGLWGEKVLRRTMSKKGACFFSLMMLDSSFHCS
jgi:hypothetical protein